MQINNQNEHHFYKHKLTSFFQSIKLVFYRKKHFDEKIKHSKILQQYWKSSKPTHTHKTRTQIQIFVSQPFPLFPQLPNRQSRSNQQPKQHRILQHYWKPQNNNKKINTDTKWEPSFPNPFLHSLQKQTETPQTSQSKLHQIQQNTSNSTNQ